MALFMKVTGKIVRPQEKVDSFMLMAMFMTENGKTIKPMVLVFIRI